MKKSWRQEAILLIVYIIYAVGVVEPARHPVNWIPRQRQQQQQQQQVNAITRDRQPQKYQSLPCVIPLNECVPFN